VTDFSKLLNPEQFEAATYSQGPLLCLAAAGTGKTRTLVHRVAYLIENGVPAERIILLTFTNRAAREMLERAQALSGDKVSSIWSGTFHSICAKLLRAYGSKLGYKPGFSILDEDDQKRLIGRIIKDLVPDSKDFLKKEIVAKIISQAANEELSVEQVASRWQSKVANVDVDMIVKIAQVYDGRKRELGAMDFDDLLVNGLNLLQTQDDIRNFLQEHFLYVLVDEYQDTNSLQAKFTDILAAKHKNIMAVGDDFQCIYTWRGAQIENILGFPKRWAGCKIVKLERNYRSVPSVLQVANDLMSDASGQFNKRLKPTRSSAGAIPRLYIAYDGRAQANEILYYVSEMKSRGYSYNQMAILYRSHFHSIEIQMMLARNRIPFKITSGIGVFEQVHIKDTLSYLRLLLNPADELSFMRIVELLPGVGEKSAHSLWKKMHKSFDMSSAEARETFANLLPAKAKPIWKGLGKAFEVAVEYLAENKIADIIEDFCFLFYEDHLEREYEQSEAEDRLNDIKELSAQIVSSPGTLTEFLAEVALMTNLDDPNNNSKVDKITLSTVHQSKGMEWPVVVVPWCCEGMFPSSKATDEGRADEERRLFYVALTRAKDELSMFVPQMRKQPDGSQFPVQPSIFVRSINQQFVERRQARYVPDPPRFGGGYKRW
jgi:DNA helicase-2/ATP-dependent DNA helicase PcrA